MFDFLALGVVVALGSTRKSFRQLVVDIEAEAHAIIHHLGCHVNLSLPTSHEADMLTLHEEVILGRTK